MRVRRDEVQRQIQAEKQDKDCLQQGISLLTKTLPHGQEVTAMNMCSPRAAAVQTSRTCV